LTPLEFPSLVPGWVVGTRLELGDRHLTLVNVHVELDSDGLATTTLTRIIAELGDVLGGPDVIFGGDLNVDPLIDEVYGGHRHSEVLGRLRELGLFHVNSQLPPGVRTNAKSKHPFQIDHLFVSESLRESVEDVQVVVGSRILTLSDHFPLLLDLNLDGPAGAAS
jgi:endonuclease/exonuclease/phosphatase family metal-dependent hydrolase